MSTEDKGKLHAVLRLKDGTRLEVRDAFKMGDGTLCMSPDENHMCYGYGLRCANHQGVGLYPICISKGVYFLEVEDD